MQLQTKLFEIRDSGTHIVAMGTLMEPTNDRQRYQLARAGYAQGSNLIYLARISSVGIATYDLYDWESSTMRHAHEYIQNHWDELKDGDVVDVEFIAGITKTKKVSEQYGEY